MDKMEQMIILAEKEMTEFSTEARKIEKLKQKYTFIASLDQRKLIRDQLVQKINRNQLSPILEKNRFAIALPFWGVGGLGLLLGISMQQPLDFIATAVGLTLAFLIQKTGFEIETMQLVIHTLEEMEKST